MPVNCPSAPGKPDSDTHDSFSHGTMSCSDIPEQLGIFGERLSDVAIQREDLSPASCAEGDGVAISAGFAYFLDNRRYFGLPSSRQRLNFHHHDYFQEAIVEDA